MAPKQDSSLLGNNCQLTLDLQENIGSVLPTAVNLLSHCVSAMLQDAFSSLRNHSRIPQESAVGVSGLQVTPILFICNRFESPCTVFSGKQSAATHSGDTPGIIAVLRQLEFN